MLAAVVAGLVLLAGGIGIGWGINRGGSPSGSGDAIRTVSPRDPSAGGRALSARAIAGRVEPAVVDINTLIDAFGGSRIGGQAAGTGMIITSGGEVLTNNHVIAGATSIRVTIVGRSGSYSATVIGADPRDDVALLQIQGVSGLATVTLADSSGLKVGQRVIAIGNALGRGGTPSVTEGVIAALDRSITAGTENGNPEDLSGLIQSNAPISPGDSGGPLVNGDGQVIGMITAASSTDATTRTSTVGFAISTNSALGVVNSIRSGQASPAIILGQPGFLGVDVQALDPATAAQLGLAGTSGVLVAGIIPGTPAERIGIPTHAVITAINGHPVTSPETLGPAIYTHKPGERIEVTWVDRNGTHTVAVALMAGPAV